MKTKYKSIKSFDNEQEAIKFENEKRALNKLQQKRERESKTKEQRRDRKFIDNMVVLMNVKVKLLDN